MTRALITGIAGQDGSYLTELLLGKGYDVHGIVRRNSDPTRSHLGPLCRDPAVFGKQLYFHTGDLDDPTALRRIFNKVAPDEVYHLAGQSQVGMSFEFPEITCEMTGMGSLRVLEIIRDLPKIPRFFHASSSEIFGRPEQYPQDENTPAAPVNPYGCAKAFATSLVKVYRTSHKLFACNGILYNHESPRRGESFVTRKICRAAAAIKSGRQQELMLGDTSSLRDWGHARDYVAGMWQTLQANEPDDFVFATGQLHSVQDVVETAFAHVSLDWREYVKQDARFMRPSESLRLLGNATKARTVLGWEPKTGFKELIAEMTEADLRAFAGKSG